MREHLADHDLGNGAEIPLASSCVGKNYDVGASIRYAATGQRCVLKRVRPDDFVDQG